MRFAAIFTAVLSLGFLAAAAPTPVGNSISLRSDVVDVAVRGIVPRCDCENTTPATLVSNIVSLKADVDVALAAITDACNAPGGVTLAVLTTLFAELTVKLNLFVTAVLAVKANISITGLLGINIDIVLLATACANIFIDLFVCLQLVLKVCVEANVLVAAVVKLCVTILADLEVCVPGVCAAIGLIVKVSLSVFASVCASVNVDILAALQLSV